MALLFPKTTTQLGNLQQALSCIQCNVQSPTVCTLGACEHLFCRDCCKTFVGTCCPLCDIPSHVKDAEVNQQLSNLASLCKELGRILACRGEDDVTTGEDDIHLETPPTIKSPIDLRLVSDTCSTVTKPASNRKRSGRDGNLSTMASKPVACKLSPVNRKTRVSNEGDDECDDRTTRKGRASRKDTSDRSAVPGPSKKCTGSKRNVARSRSRGQRETSRDAMCSEDGVPTTMTHLCDDQSEENGEEDERLDSEVTRDRGARNRSGDGRLQSRIRSSSRQNTKSENQSTMTQFFEYNDDELPLLDMGDESANKAPVLKQMTPVSRTRRRSRSESNTPRGRTTRVRSRDAGMRSRDTGPPQDSATSGGLSTPRDGRKRVRSQKGKLPTTEPVPVIHNSPPKRGRKSLEGNTRESPLAKKNARGETPLHVAAIKGDIKRVMSLLKSGASTNVRDNAGWTPLHECCNHGHTAIVDLLLSHGAQINIPGLDNDTPLHDAVANYRLDVVKLLVARGASLSARNMHGKTPLSLAKTEEMRNALNTPVISDLANVTDVSMTECEEEFQVLCFMGTALSRDQGLLLQKCASILHAKVLDTFSHEVSHVITACNYEGQCPRTLKYLNAVLAGKWVVSCEWLDLCIEYKQKVCEEAFEVPGSSTNPDSQAASRGRHNRRQQLPGLFDGCQFYFHGSFNSPTPEKEELQSLVRCGGGNILTREPKLHNIDDYAATVPYHADTASKLKDNGVFIIHDNKAWYPELRSNRLCVVPAVWIMDCIASFRILDPPQK